MADTLQPIPQLGWREMSRTVTVLRTPNSLLRSLCISNEETMLGESVDLMKMFRGRRAAPMVRRDGPAEFVPNQGEIHGTVVTPNISLKKAFSPSELLYERRGGTSIYADKTERDAAASAFIARELAETEDQIRNREEWMVAQTLRGQISYSVAGQDHFTVTYPKSANQTVALGAGDRWDEATSNPLNDIRTAKQVMEANTQLQPTIALCSQSAADAFLDNAKVREVLDNRRIQAGSVTFNSDVDLDGAMFLGVVGGIPFYQYSRTVDVPQADGSYVTEALIRDKYVEFINTTAAAECWMYYGGIADMQTIGAGRTAALKRFSKSWMQEEPSAQMYVIKSRPLPVARKPDFCYSLQVLA